jgi:para-nitrobenzyl esterase
MSNSENRIILNRREALLLAAAGGIGAALARPAAASDSTKTDVHQEPGFCSTPKSAVANTQYGKVRGFVSGDVFTFKGIPYGQTTAGENRWLPAKAPVPWKDEYPALIYGGNCPQNLHNWTGLEQVFIQDWDDGYISEDMLKLNIWTPSLSGKRAVMFYIHGGGFAGGSSYELPSHEGAQMARHHDVVQISVNHRLNALGFLDVSEIGGPEFADSVNLGLTDLVVALRWVRDNIANFGGDPDRVTIYGQSGGGYKVAYLLGMPSAKGLFHRAIIQSGGNGTPPTVEQSRAIAKQMMVELGLQPNDIVGLQKTEWSKLMAASSAAAGKVGLPHQSGPVPSANTTPRVTWGAAVDGRIVTMNSLIDSSPEVSKDVPLMVGSVSEEGNRMISHPTETEWLATLTSQLGEAKATALVAAMKKAHPEKSIRTLSYGVTGLTWRNSVLRILKLKHAQKAAPVFAYYFTWQSPMLEDAGAWHTADLQFCFDNTKRCAQGTGNTPEAQALAKKMATAWANFARTGNPSQPGLTWEPADPDRFQNMVWNNECRMVDDPDGEARKILEN